MKAANEHVYCVLHCRGKAVGDRRSQTGGWWPQLVTVKPTTVSRPERCVDVCGCFLYGVHQSPQTEKCGDVVMYQLGRGRTLA